MRKVLYDAAFAALDLVEDRDDWRERLMERAATLGRRPGEIDWAAEARKAVFAAMIDLRTLEVASGTPGVHSITLYAGFGDTLELDCRHLPDRLTVYDGERAYRTAADLEAIKSQVEDKERTRDSNE